MLETPLAEDVTFRIGDYEITMARVDAERMREGIVRGKITDVDLAGVPGGPFSPSEVAAAITKALA